MQPLTDHQRQMLDWIKAHKRRFGVPPTRSGLARGPELRGASSVDVHLKALTRKSWIEIEPNMQRGIRPYESPHFGYQMTPKISRYTRCSMSIRESLSTNGRNRCSGQFGMCSYSINP